MKTIEEINEIASSPRFEWRGEQDIDVWKAGYTEGRKDGAATQKAIDDAELAEVKRQRDEYYDELLKLRQQKVGLIEWLKEEASRCREGATTGYDAYEIGTFEGQYMLAEEVIDKIKAMEE